MEQQTSDTDKLVTRASSYVYTLFRDELPEDIVYHTYRHTVEVAKEAARIGAKVGLTPDDQRLVSLAAWFHDTGFTQCYDGHEERGAGIAAAFLREEGVPEQEIERVVALIHSTHTDAEPADLLEEVLHDADLAHVGKKRKFFEFSDRLRREWELRKGAEYTDREWAEIQLEFLSNVRFATPFARKRFDETKQRNTLRVQNTLAELLDAQRPMPDTEERGVPSRGIETMFRTSYRNHINLSSIADSKANIMISVNAILMSIIVSFVSTRLQEDVLLLVPASCMLLTSLLAIVFAILSARPKVTSRVFTLEDVHARRSNILFFGNFVNMPLDDFKLGMRELMADWDRLYDSMISDIYSLGEVLRRKYRLLWLSYTIFMAGLVATVVLFLVLFLLFGDAPPT